jgi:hypothetical protein
MRATEHTMLKVLAELQKLVAMLERQRILKIRDDRQQRRAK